MWKRSGSALWNFVSTLCNTAARPAFSAQPPRIPMKPTAAQALQDGWTPDRIIQLRERLGLTQKEFALCLGYSHPSRVSELEAGTRKVTLPVAILLEYLDRYGPLDA